MKYIPYGPSMLSYEMYTVYGMKFPHLVYVSPIHLPRVLHGVYQMGEGRWVPMRGTIWMETPLGS